MIHDSHITILECDEHHAGLLQHIAEYRGKDSADCRKQARADGWRIERRKATCPNCARQQDFARQQETTK